MPSLNLTAGALQFLCKEIRKWSVRSFFFLHYCDFKTKYPRGKVFEGSMGRKDSLAECGVHLVSKARMASWLHSGPQSIFVLPYFLISLLPKHMERRLVVGERRKRLRFICHLMQCTQERIGWECIQLVGVEAWVNRLKFLQSGYFDYHFLTVSPELRQNTSSHQPRKQCSFHV